MMYSALRHVSAIAWKRRPIQLTFFVTRRCNLRCPFCFYLRSAGPAARPGPELDLDEIRRVSRSVGRLLWLAFSGGEVFLRPDLVEISRAFYDSARPAIMLYPTNGQLPEAIRDATEAIATQCRKSAVVVKLSMDGLDGVHDALRQRAGCFERVMTTYRLLSQLADRHPNLELGINTVMCSDNQDAMEEVIGFVRGLRNARAHTISLVRGELLEARYKDVDATRYARAIRSLEEDLHRGASPRYRFPGSRLKAAQDVLQRRLIHRTLLAGTRLTACYAGRLNLVLTETGAVYPCESAAEGLGNVRDHGLDMGRLLRSDRARKVREAIRGGGCFCTHECYMMTNILFNPRWYPALAREYLRLPGAGDRCQPGVPRRDG